MLKRRCCYSCGQKKELSEYSKNSKGRDGLDWYCRECKKDKASKYYKQTIEKCKEEERDKQEKSQQSQRYKDRVLYNKIKRDKNRQYIQDIKSSGCCICQEKTLQCLDFHHINPNDKEHQISNMIAFSLENILIEIQKCVIVCANCHRKIHYGLIECPNVSPNTIGLPQGAP
jgi:hypothetical protein